MNKTYESPRSTVLLMQTESMLAASLQYDPTDTKDRGASSALSDERSFESPIWGSDEE